MTTGAIVPFARMALGYVLVFSAVAALVLIGLLTVKALGVVSVEDAASFINMVTGREFLIFLAVGFVAQLVDGSLGMAYGITATSFLMSAGVSPAVASAGVHVSEVFTTAVSGFSHWRFGNVDLRLFRRLAIPGAIGAAIGSYVLSSVDSSVISPFMSIYLIIMGGVVIRKAFMQRLKHTAPPKRVAWLALFGGFMDSSGGGGWGPIVSTTLLGKGNHPRKTIGTVNAAEFLVALTASSVFTVFLGLGNWDVVLGLIVGGTLAAPIAAYICHRINVRVAMTIVGVVIILLSIRTLLKVLGMWW